jgi:hypothetical protein
VTLPEKGWKVLVNGERAGTKPLARIKGDTVIVPAVAALVLAKA